jgi:hypothetical protein
MTLIQCVCNYDDENTESCVPLTEDEFCLERGIHIPAQSKFRSRCGAKQP